MSRVALKRVTVFNFRSFFGQHNLDFDEHGLYLIRGSNLDSRGESGAGKSSLLIAIAYALNFSPYSIADLTNWDAGDDPMWVEIELSTEDGQVVLHRGDKLWMKVGKGKPLTSAKSVEEKLIQILKIPPGLREAITYRRQRKPGMFLAMRDSEKKSFLVELLGLEWLEKEIAAQVKVASHWQRQVDDVIGPVLKKAQADLEYAEQSALPMQVIDLSPLDERVSTLGDESENIRNKMAAVSHLRKKAVESHTPDRTEVDKLKAVYTECVKREVRAQVAEDRLRSENFSLHMAYREEQKSIADLQGKRIVLLQRAQLLQDDKCSECHRQWDEAGKELDSVQHQIREVSKGIDEIKAKQPPPTFVSDGKLGKLREMRSDLESRILEEERKIESAKHARVARYQDQLDVLMQSLTEKNREVSQAELEAQTARLTNRANLDKHDLEQKLIQRARETRNEEAKKHLEAKATLATEQDYLEMLRGFMAKYFADILTQISDEANKVIGNLPNTSHVTLQFDVERETQDGKMRNEITPTIYFGDRKWSLDAGASGGMYTSIELAVDLAVGRIIADRTGCDIGWLILDESFNGHDKITKESCLQILQQYASDKLIIIVDHASEFKEMFSRVVEVKLQNGRSVLEAT